MSEPRGGGVRNPESNRRAGVRTDQTGTRFPAVSSTRAAESARRMGLDLPHPQHPQAPSVLLWIAARCGPTRSNRLLLERRSGICPEINNSQTGSESGRGHLARCRPTDALHQNRPRSGASKLGDFRGFGRRRPARHEALHVAGANAETGDSIGELAAAARRKASVVRHKY